MLNPFSYLLGKLIAWDRARIIKEMKEEEQTISVNLKKCTTYKVVKPKPRNRMRIKKRKINE